MIVRVTTSSNCSGRARPNPQISSHNSSFSTVPVSQLDPLHRSRVTTQPFPQFPGTSRPSPQLPCHNSTLSTDPGSQFDPLHRSRAQLDPLHSSRVTTRPSPQFPGHNSTLSTDPVSQLDLLHSSRVTTRPSPQFPGHNSTLSTDPRLRGGSESGSWLSDLSRSSDLSWSAVISSCSGRRLAVSDSGLTWSGRKVT